MRYFGIDQFLYDSVAKYRDNRWLIHGTAVSGCMLELQSYMERFSYELPAADRSSKLSVVI